MSSALAYAPRPTPLGRAAPGAAAIHLWSFAAIAFVVSNPIVLAGCALAVAIAGVAAGARAALVLAVRWGATLGIVIVAVNALASQRGDTILVRGPEVPVLGTLDITGEALAEGGVLALRIAIVFAAFAVHTACVDPDRLMRLARPLARRSALTATLIARLAPLTAADHARVSEAVVLRGPGRRPSAALHCFDAWYRDRSTAPSTSPPRSSSADTRAKRRAGATRRPRAPGDLAFALSGLGALGLAVAARLAGVAGYESYPQITLDADASTLALAAALPTAALVPLALDRIRSRRIPELRHAH